MTYLKITFFLFLLGFVPVIIPAQTSEWNKQAIQPFQENPSYWQYEGKPLLLLGATDNDNIFQMPHFGTHLDSLAGFGGNYIRCTMSDRDPGDLRAFAKNEEGKYDLTRWNNAYWNQFEDLLRTAHDRNIIVQIEVWDRFDHSREEWLSDPWNPANNVNYTYEEVNLKPTYPNHPGANEQPFFYTVPGLDDNQVLLSWQKSFVDKLLSISLKYNNVLYCMDNETKGAPEWGAYWARYIKEIAGGKQVKVTEMWDDWDVREGRHKETIDHPELYDFIDLSQNSQTTGHANWINPQEIFDYIHSSPRPANSVKIYGGPWNPGYVRQGKNAEHAVQTFFKNILGGFASSRFHRPPTGLGMSERSIQAIRTIRAIESKVKFWDITPRMDLLSDGQPGEAYLATNEGKSYVVYFPGDGEIDLILNNSNKDLEGAWISTRDATWLETHRIPTNQSINLSPPDGMGWVYVIY